MRGPGLNQLEVNQEASA